MRCRARIFIFRCCRLHNIVGSVGIYLWRATFSMRVHAISRFLVHHSNLAVPVNVKYTV